MQESRRKFLKSVGAVSGASLLPGCTSLDRLVLGERLDERNKVVILGGGLAGLTAAFQLKKNRVPFRVFEGSRRVGGRALTVQDANDNGQNVDLGAERVLAHQSNLIALCRELKVELIEMRPTVGFAYWNQSQFVSEKEERKFFGEVQNFFGKLNQLCYGRSQETLNRLNVQQFPQAAQLDSVTAEDFLAKNKDFFVGWKRDWVEALIRRSWGVEPRELSGLGLLHGFRDQVFSENQKSFKIDDGFSALTGSLYDQVAGVIPGRLVQLQHRLVEIEIEESEYVLTFDTPRGRDQYRARHVLCTLPWKILKEVKGARHLAFQDMDRDYLNFVDWGSHSKVAMSFKSPFWKDSRVLGTGGTWLTSLPSQNFSEGGSPSRNPLATPKKILVSQIGGKAANAAGVHSVDQVLLDLKAMGFSSEGFDQQFYVQNWSQYPWAQGSRAYPKVGAFQKANPEPIIAGTWVFAGDGVVANQMGTAEAAVQSALKAAQALSRFQKS